MQQLTAEKELKTFAMTVKQHSSLLVRVVSGTFLCHKEINVYSRAASDVRTMQWTIEQSCRNNGLRPISLMYGQLG